MHPVDQLRDRAIGQFNWSIKRIGFITQNIPEEWVGIVDWCEKSVAGPAIRYLQYEIDFLSTGSVSHLDGLLFFWGQFEEQVKNLGEGLERRSHLQAVNNDYAWIDGSAPEKYAEGLRLMALGFAYTASYTNQIREGMARNMQQMADLWMGKFLQALTIRQIISIVPSFSAQGVIIKAAIALLSAIGWGLATPSQPNTTIPKQTNTKWPELDLW